MKIGIVTFEFPGLTKNGGIGTAYGRIAHLLAEAGHSVVVHFLVLDKTALQDLPEATNIPSSHKKISFEIVMPFNGLEFYHSWSLARSVAVFNSIRDKGYDVIHIHDCLGLAWVSLKNQALGIALQESKIVLGMHGPNFWVNEAHGKISSDPHEYLEARMERECVEMCEHVVSPSQYMLNYLKSWNWTFGGEPTVIPNVNHADLLKKATQRKDKPAPHKINRIIFFGRLEARKGLILFLEALQVLATTDAFQGRAEPLQVIFMGRETQLPNGEWAAAEIARCMDPLAGAFQYELMSDLNSDDCANFFQLNPDSLICMPSLVDNSPYAAVEALEQGLNFLTTTNGGQSEILQLDSAQESLCFPIAAHFSNGILFKLTNSYSLPKPHPQLVEANTKWLNYHKALGAKVRTPQVRKSPKICVVVLAKGGSDKLADTLTTVRMQTEKPEEVFVFNWGQTNHISAAMFDAVKNFYGEKWFRFFQAIETNFDANGEVRIEELIQRAAEESTSDFIFVIRDGDLLSKDAVDTVKKSIAAKPADVCFFGMLNHGVQSLPGPIEFNYSLFFDGMNKFPFAFRRKFAEKMRVVHQEDTVGVDPTLALEMEVSKTPFSVVPEAVLDSRFRVAFLPYNKGSFQQVWSRLRMSSQHLPREYQRSLELVAGLVLRS